MSTVTLITCAFKCITTTLTNPTCTQKRGNYNHMQLTTGPPWQLVLLCPACECHLWGNRTNGLYFSQHIDRHPKDIWLATVRAEHRTRQVQYGFLKYILNIQYSIFILLCFILVGTNSRRQALVDKTSDTSLRDVFQNPFPEAESLENLGQVATSSFLSIK